VLAKPNTKDNTKNLNIHKTKPNETKAVSQVQIGFYSIQPGNGWSLLDSCWTCNGTVMWLLLMKFSRMKDMPKM